MVNIIDPREHNIVTSTGIIKGKVVYDIIYKDKAMTGKIMFNGTERNVYQRRSLWHLEE
jgi:hypothetical protein